MFALPSYHDALQTPVGAYEVKNCAPTHRTALWPHRHQILQHQCLVAGRPSVAVRECVLQRLLCLLLQTPPLETQICRASLARARIVSRTTGKATPDHAGCIKCQPAGCLRSFHQTLRGDRRRTCRLRAGRLETQQSQQTAWAARESRVTAGQQLRECLYQRRGGSTMDSSPAHCPVNQHQASTWRESTVRIRFLHSRSVLRRK